MRELQPHPLKLRPVYKEKIWGGRNLARLLGKQLPDGDIGESWEIADESIVAEGSLAGRSLAELVGMFGPALIGSLCDAPDCLSFPLLIKFIDAHDRLSVQVHPDDSYANKYEGWPRGKTEMWYVLDAAPGAEVIHGLATADAAPADISSLAATGQLVRHLYRLPVAKGDVIFIPAGTVHAMGEGLVICEVQQNCDLTYRLYDWDRLENGRPRQLHVDKAVAVARPGPKEHKIPSVLLAEPWGERRVLAACRYFATELLTLNSRRDAVADGRSFFAFMALRGSGTIHWRDMSISITAGDSAVIPAALGEYSLIPAGELSLIASYVPDLRHDIVVPLSRAGVPREDILRLGGDPDTNDIASVI